MHKFRALFACLLSVTVLSCFAPTAAYAQEPNPAAEQEQGVSAAFDNALVTFNEAISTLLFFSVTGDAFDMDEVDRDGNVVKDKNGQAKLKKVGFPFIVFVLVAGGIFFTLFFRFINVRGFRHAIDVVRGKFDNPEDEGDVSHFRAFTSALSATVGLGNIAGVAIAIQLGGPGAVMWMILAAIFGMSLKFNSCTLAQMFRQKNPDGSISGGPMYYIDIGLRKIGGEGSATAMLGKGLAVVYALMIIGGSFGGGNMFQANQAYSAVEGAFGAVPWFKHAFGIGLAVMVGLVIVGGIQRIGAATSRIVPAMVGIYCAASLYIIVANIGQVPATLMLIVERAFSQNAVYGGAVGVLVWGFKRASFSNEAGIGSAAVAHAAAKTDEPVREGLVAMLGPVVDTIIVCLMTAMVVVITGAWDNPEHVGLAGVKLTQAAFSSEISWFPMVLTVCVFLFAYSTMISWAYYGERGWIYLLDHYRAGAGVRTLLGYRLLFVGFVYVGAVAQLKNVLDFSDLMILCMAFPNIVGGAILAPSVKRALVDYWQRFTAGSFKVYDQKPEPNATTSV